MSPPGGKEDPPGAKSPPSAKSGAAPDVNDLFGSVLGQWEELTNQFANSMMRTSEFSRGMNSATQVTLEFRKAMAEQMSRLLAVANLPSRAELIELHRAVNENTARLSRIESMLSKLLQAPGSSSRSASSPPRTKRPPSAVTKRD